MSMLKILSPLAMTALIVVTIVQPHRGEAAADGRVTIEETTRPVDAATVIDRLVAAHGGRDAWEAAKAVRFDHLLYMSFLPEGADRWWVANNQVVERTGPRRVHQEYPKHDARLAYDGERVWTLGWGEKNLPGFMVYFDYYFVFLPWLVSEDRMRLEAPETGRLPGDPKRYTTVRASFRPDRPVLGKSELDYFRLFIDPASNRLAAVEYAMGYAPQMRVMGVPEGGVFGPLIHIFDSFAESGGLDLPRRFHTVTPGGELAGDHLIVNVSLETELDLSRLAPPPGARIDETVPR